MTYETRETQQGQTNYSWLILWYGSW